MGHHEYLHYQMEIQEIKHLLVENPYGLPQITIQIHTSICHDDYTSLAELLRYIDQSIAFYLPQSVYHISIYRNSPPLLDVSICEMLPALLPYLFTLAVYVFGATNKSVSLFQDICKAHGIRLDNQEKKIHLKAAEEQEALKTEHMRLENRLLQAQIAHQEMELEKNRREIAEESTLIATDVSDMPPEVKQQISAIEFSIQTDDLGISELRQGVLYLPCKKAIVQPHFIGLCDGYHLSILIGIFHCPVLLVMQSLPTIQIGSFGCQGAVRAGFPCPLAQPYLKNAEIAIHHNGEMSAPNLCELWHNQ